MNALGCGDCEERKKGGEESKKGVRRGGGGEERSRGVRRGGGVRRGVGG